MILITGSQSGTVNCRLQFEPRKPSEKLNIRKLTSSYRRFDSHLKIAAENSFLTYRCNFAKAYPGSIHGLEGVARVFVKNGKTTSERETLVITGMDISGGMPAVIIKMLVAFEPGRKLQSI